MRNNAAITEHPYHRSLRLQNFTVFRDASFEFVPGINVLIGKNGSGKTHLMKVMYSIQMQNYRPRKGEASNYLVSIFQANTDSLVRLPIANHSHAMISGQWSEAPPWQYVINSVVASSWSGFHLTIEMPRPIFIPAVDMMAHTRRFVSTYDEYQIDFDQTHRDVVALLLSPEKREQPTGNGILTTLKSTLGGEVEEENERFYLQTPQGRFSMPLVAEGLRKIATLYQLLKNGFLKPGDVLFWDEPEVNLNPSLMGKLIDVLLALARTGVQTFLATHSYVILKELDLQSTATDKVRYFALEPTDDGTIVHATDDYAQIEPNAIAEQYDSLYDRQITRSMNSSKSR